MSIVNHIGKSNMFFLFLLSFLLLTVSIIFFDSYMFTYLMMFTFTLAACNIGTFFSRMFALFILIYLGIALLDISSYRGEIYLITLKVYSVAVLFIFTTSFIMDIFLRKRNTDRVYLLPFNERQKYLILGHLSIVYLALLYIYVSVGNVLFNQDLRFFIPTSLGYIIKSSIYIPLIYWAVRQVRKKADIFLYVFIPLAPAMLIGSRGTVIMIMIGMLIIQFLQSKEDMKGLAFEKVLFSKYLVFKSAGLGLFMIYTLYYIRRLSSSSNFLSPSEALNEYFYSDSWFGYFVMPLHLAFKETFGLTNRIISDDLSNLLTSIPLFFADLITILPGKQVGAGEAMGIVFGTVAAGGLTPGIVGGLYLDFGYFLCLIISFFIAVIKYVEFKAKQSEFWLVFFSLSFVQFLHLFHRGFLKPEYIFAFIIVLFYLRLNSGLLVKGGSK